LRIIRVLARGKKVEIFFQTGNEVSPVETIHSATASLLFEYIESWQNWVKQVDALSYALPGKDHNYRDRFLEFSKSLSSILFGGVSIPFSYETVWILDKEYMGLPVEILKTEPTQTFYRNIRSTQVPPQGRIGEDSLFVENLFQAENLLTELKEERKEILNLWDSYQISYKELLGISCTRTRFIEKIASISVLHYSGHSFEDGLWFGEDSFLGISDLSSLNLSNLNLVSLNSCSSAIGLARGFLESGAKECVGFLGPVRNDISRQAGTIFWTNYLKSGSASRSAQKVREELQVLHGSFYPAAYQFVHFGVPPKKKSFWILKKKFLFVTLVVLFLGLLFPLGFYNFQKPQEISKLPQVKEIQKETLEIHILKDSRSSEGKISNPSTTPMKNSPKEKVFNKTLVNNKSNPKPNPIEVDPPIKEEKKISEKTYDWINNSEPRLEKYLQALRSESLKTSIRNYLQKKDPIVSSERKRDKIERILESTESEELIQYKLRELDPF
jgi:hypothetical protein